MTIDEITSWVDIQEAEESLAGDEIALRAIAILACNPEVMDIFMHEGRNPDAAVAVIEGIADVVGAKRMLSRIGEDILQFPDKAPRDSELLAGCLRQIFSTPASSARPRIAIAEEVWMKTPEIRRLPLFNAVKIGEKVARINPTHYAVPSYSRR